MKILSCRLLPSQSIKLGVVEVSPNLSYVLIRRYMSSWLCLTPLLIISAGTVRKLALRAPWDPIRGSPFAKTRLGTSLTHSVFPLIWLAGRRSRTQLVVFPVFLTPHVKTTGCKSAIQIEDSTPDTAARVMTFTSRFLWPYAERIHRVVEPYKAGE